MNYLKKRPAHKPEGKNLAEDWQKIESEKSAKILAEVNPFLEPVPFAPETTTIRSRNLSFYTDYSFLELTDMSAVPAARKYAIYKQGDVNVINWTNQTIYETNEKAPVIINAETVADYVRFFFSYVRGRYGRFVLIESFEDIRWQAEPPEQGRKIIQDMLEPVTIVETQADGGFILCAYMLFKDSLFKTSIQVKKDGLVSMSDEEPKIEGMPVLQDAA